MNMALPKRGLARHAAALITSAAAVALVTASIYALDSFAPVLSLGVLYLFAVLLVAVLFGLTWAIPVSVASMLAFNWFFLPPRHTLRLSDGENWIALAVYLVTAVVVSALAMRSRAREEEAHERALEASLLARSPQRCSKASTCKASSETSRTGSPRHSESRGRGSSWTRFAVPSAASRRST